MDARSPQDPPTPPPPDTVPATDGPVRLRVDLAYDGTPFHGFARQPSVTTVQGTLEGALSRVLGAEAPTTGAGRTDAGVHASAQVVHVDVDPTVPRVARALEDLERCRAALDALTGDAIVVTALRVVDPAFDARFAATRRGYRYRVLDAPLADPLRRRRVWHVPGPLDVDAMRAGAALLLGEHDFASFCRRAEGRTTVRRLEELGVDRRDDEVHVTLRGPAFCHQQVRAVVGCLAEVGRRRRPAAWIAEVLAARDRAAAVAIAPPHGLTLEHVSYGDRYPPAGG